MCHSAYLGLEDAVNSTRHQLQGLGEEVIEQAHEDGGVVGGELAEVEVPQRAEHDLRSSSSGSGSTRCIRVYAFQGYD